MSLSINGKWWYAGFEPSTRGAIRNMLDLAEVRLGEIVYDIGCGNGVILLEAQKRGAQVAGVDYYLSRVNKTKNRLGESALIVYGDIFDDSFWGHKGSEMPYVVGGANVVTLFLNETMNNKLSPLLEKELKPGTRVVSNCWTIDGWKTIRDDPKMETHLYTVPDSFLPMPEYR